MITRRTLAGALLATTALAACSTTGQTSAQIVATVLTDATTIANGLLNVLPNVQGVPPAIAGAVATYAQQALAAAQSLSASMTQTQAQPVIQQIKADVEKVATAVQPYLTPGSQGAVILSDIQVVLPLLLTAVQLAAPAGAAPGSDVAAARARLAALPRRT